MIDFTLKAYQHYLCAIKSWSHNIITLGEYFKNRPGHSFCVLRHDVDRKPKHALRVAQLEHKMNVTATYFFRIKRHTFKPDIIRIIHELGHEIGYHYENVSDMNGNLTGALDDFRKQLARLRRLVPVSTIAMHGRPFSPYDNRILWQNADTKQVLTSELGIAGDATLDIDYTNIYYISDTGRNWHSSRSNIRDRVDSQLTVAFAGSHELVAFLGSAQPYPIIFQTHPERWSHNWLEWVAQWSMDQVVNMAKAFWICCNSVNKRLKP